MRDGKIKGSREVMKVEDLFPLTQHKDELSKLAEITSKDSVDVLNEGQLSSLATDYFL